MSAAAERAGLRWTGVVLTGGSSRRMGRDKALLEVDGVPLARRAADALFDAGAADVFCVGGDEEGLAARGLRVEPDRFPGEGPLGAIVTALGIASTDVVMVLSCDLVDPDPRAIRATVVALEQAPDADGAVPTAGDRSQPLHAAYRRHLHDRLAAVFSAGERSITRTLDQLAVVRVEGVEPEAMADADSPHDLPPHGGR